MTKERDRIGKCNRCKFIMEDKKPRSSCVKDSDCLPEHITREKYKRKHIEVEVCVLAPKIAATATLKKTAAMLRRFFHAWPLPSDAC